MTRLLKDVCLSHRLCSEVCNTDTILLVLDRSLDHDILQLLFGTHAIYSDRDSRLAVQKCLVAILSEDVSRKNLGLLVRAMRQESQKNGIASSSAFVLVEWCSLLLQHLAGSSVWDEYYIDILFTNANLLEKCVQAPSRNSIRRSATVVTRRGFRKLFAHTETREKRLTEAVMILTAKSNQSMVNHAPILGVIAGVCARQSNLKPILGNLKQKYFEFHNREMASSRTPLPGHITTGLYDFFHNFIVLDDVGNELIPSLEKGLLRAPEVILNGILKHFIEALPDSIDLSTLLRDKLLKPIISNIKSSNSTVRTGALASFHAIVAKCHDIETTDYVSDEILGPLKSGKLSSPDHRALYADMLKPLPLSLRGAENIATALATVASKEGNEAALASEVSTLAQAVILILGKSGAIKNSVLESLVKGLVDKKPASRRIWILNIGNILRAVDSIGPATENTSFIQGTVSKLITTFNEVIANAASAAQNGLIVGAYVLTALTPVMQSQHRKSPLEIELRKAPVVSLAVATAQSYLLNYRLYNKLTVEEDVEWFCDALISVVGELASQKNHDVLLAWAEAIIYLITASNLPSKIRQELAKSVSTFYAQKPKFVADVIINGLWNVLGRTEDCRVEKGNLIRALQIICLEPGNFIAAGTTCPKELLEAQACAMLVLSSPDLIPRSSWISFCLRMGLDPGAIAAKHTEDLLKEIEQRTSLKQKVGS